MPVSTPVLPPQLAPLLGCDCPGTPACEAAGQSGSGVVGAGQEGCVVQQPATMPSTQPGQLKLVVFQRLCIVPFSRLSVVAVDWLTPVLVAHLLVVLLVRSQAATPCVQAAGPATVTVQDQQCQAASGWGKRFDDALRREPSQGALDALNLLQAMGSASEASQVGGFAAL
jgi:hypothetical protein